jgi:hypothetical protein
MTFTRLVLILVPVFWLSIGNSETAVRCSLLPPRLDID